MEEVRVWKVKDRFETDSMGLKRRFVIGLMLTRICRGCPFFNDCEPTQRLRWDKWQIIPHHGFNHNQDCYFNRQNRY
jgi:hypothetical protein